MKKRTVIRLISFFAAGTIVLGAASILFYRRAVTAEREERYRGEYAFSELCDAAEGLSAALEKSQYAVSPAITAALCAEVYSRAQTASASLSSLPVSLAELEATASFFAKTGDYALWLLRASSGGDEVTEEERDNLRALGNAAALLSDNLAQLRADVGAGLVGADAAAVEAGLPSLGDSFLGMEQEFPELPSLVYDGPFSASVAEREPRMLQGASEVTADAAALVAASFLSLRSNLVAAAGESEGKIPVYRFTGGDYTVSVSKRGGFVVRAISQRTPVRSAITADAALDKAAEFLSAHGYRGMKESYHILDGHVLTVTYCAEQDGAMCYPDMVKLAVAMDTGELLRFDAQAYLTSHAQRSLPEPSVSAEDARALAGGGLTVVGERLAVIPTSGAEEIFCRELICETEDGRHYLFYVNAETGVQEKILILLEDETGTLAL